MPDTLIMDTIIRGALCEDLGQGDITTLCTVPAGKTVSGRFIAKDNCVLCGLSVLQRVFFLLDPSVSVTFRCKDGDEASAGTLIADIAGPARPILSGERVALNLIQHLSGIATKTRFYVGVLSGTKAKVVDTRKTTPGLRVLEKYAVRVGGGTNHRFNLADGVLIKDNHIRAAGSITAAVNAARAGAPHTLKIEVEVENFDMLAEALSCRADIIMFDNMTIDDMAKAVKIVAGRALTEASGNMDRKDIRAVAETGVDLISIGALTHSVSAADISLRFDN